MKPSQVMALPSLTARTVHLAAAMRPCRSGPLFRARVPQLPFRAIHTYSPLKQELPSVPQPPNPHRNFYRTHGRALFKALTLAFFTYQVWVWAWLVLETEEIKEQKNREIASLEGEVRLLEEGRKSYSPGKVILDKGT